MAELGETQMYECGAAVLNIKHMMEDCEGFTGFT